MYNLSVKKISAAVVFVLVLAVIFAVFSASVASLTGNIFGEDYAVNSMVAEAATATASDSTVVTYLDDTSYTQSTLSDTYSHQTSSLSGVGSAKLGLSSDGEAFNNGSITSSAGYVSNEYSLAEIAEAEGYTASEVASAISSGNFYYQVSFTSLTLKAYGGATGNSDSYYGSLYEREVNVTGYTSYSESVVVEDTDSYGYNSDPSTSIIGGTIVKAYSDSVFISLRTYAYAAHQATLDYKSATVYISYGYIATISIYFDEPDCEIGSSDTYGGSITIDSNVNTDSTINSASINNYVSSQAELDEVYTVTATVNDGYYFAGWIVCEDGISTIDESSTSYTITACECKCDSNILYAIFLPNELEDTYVYNANSQGPEVDDRTKGSLAISDVYKTEAGLNLSKAPSDAASYIYVPSFMIGGSIVYAPKEYSFTIEQAELNADNTAFSLTGEYGQTIAQMSFASAVTDSNLAVVEGTFTITSDKTTILEVNDTSCDITVSFVPSSSYTVNFKTSTIETTAEVSIAANIPTVSNLAVTALTYGEYLGENGFSYTITNSINSSIADIDGVFEWYDNGTLVAEYDTLSSEWSWVSGEVLPSNGSGSIVSTPSYNVIFEPTSDNYSTTSAQTIYVSVSKVDPVVTFVWSELNYGQAFDAVSFEGSMATLGSESDATAVDGVYSIATSNAIIPTNAADDNTIYTATFTPTNSANYNSYSETIVLIVNKVTPTVVFSYNGDTTNTITYGEILAYDSGVSATNSNFVTAGYSSGVTGSYVWLQGDDEFDTQMPLNADSYELTMAFIPADSDNYNAYYEGVTITVNKVTLALANISAAAITYGADITDDLLSATATFTFNDSSVTVNGVLAFDWSSSSFSKYMPAASYSGSYCSFTFTPNETETFVYNDTQYDAADNIYVYSGSTRITINKAAYAAATIQDMTIANEDVVLEDTVGSANFQVAQDAGTITIVATTSAFTKDSSGNETYVPITFEIDKSIIATIVSGTYSYSYSNGISTTTAVYTVNGTTGIVTFTASLSTTYSVNYDTSDKYYETLSVKSSQTVNGLIDISSTYGSSNIYLGNVSLSSQLTDFVIESNDTSIVTVSDDYKWVYIIGAGETTLTLYHIGTDTIAGCSSTVNVVIDKATITITTVSQNLTYGDQVVITYNYSGIKNNESEDDVISGLTNDYCGSLDSDTYTVTPQGAVADNYKFEYVSGAIVINKATLTPVFEENITKIYGDSFPELAFTYTGYQYGEDISSITTEPIVNFGTVTTDSPVATYTIYVDATSAYADNYVFDTTVTSIITVTGRDVDIDLSNINVYYSGYAPTVNATLEGVGQYDPSGSVTYYYKLAEASVAAVSDSELWSADAPISVGLYDIKVVYIARESGDNYIDTTFIFEDVLEIVAINPIFKVTGNNVVYTGINAITTATISGYGAIAPTGNFTILFECEDGQYYSSAPVNTGVYDIILKYEAVDEDNYASYTEHSTLTITAANATSTLTTIASVYNGSSIDAGTTTIYGLNSIVLDLTIENPEGTVSYNYYNGEELLDEAPQNAGTYHVEVVFTPSENGNYAAFTSKYYNAIVISKADIQTLSFVDDLVKEVDYSGYEATFSLDDIVLMGLDDADAPAGVVAFEFVLTTSITGIYSSQAINAGTYNVKITYTTTTSDNYNSTYYIALDKLIINKVEPTITMSNFDSYVYNGSGYSVSASAVGVSGGSNPEGTYTYEYKAIDAETYSSSLPINAGVYSVSVTFTATASGNYVSVLEPTEFVGIMTISAAKPSITVDYVEAEFSGTAITTTAYVVGASDSDPNAPKGYLTYTYYYNDEVCDAPITTGSYDLLVYYTAITPDGDAESNYQDSYKTFTAAVVIVNVAPTILLESIEVEYTGSSIVCADPTIDISAGDYMGTMSAEYLVLNVWTSVAPINAGTYDVRITYTAASVDNYRTTTTDSFEDALTIVKKVIVVTPYANQSKEYDGTAIDASSITYYSDVALATGNYFTGSLSVSDATIVGSYEISAGGLSAGINYQITFTKGVYYTIDKKEIELVFPELENAVYDGSAKTVAIGYDASSLVYDTDVINVYTTLVGDTVNAGQFTAVASLISSYYTLPEDYTMVYTISPAAMTGNVFEDITATYTGSAIYIYMSSIESGAAVSYNAATQYVSVGEHMVTATVTKTNYATETLTATLTIEKGYLDVIVSLAKDSYTYGDSLPTLYTNTQEGVATLDAGQTLVAGYYSYDWTFVPNNTSTYENVTGSISILVVKAEANIVISGSQLQYVGEQGNLEIYLTGVGSDVTLTASISYIDTVTGDVYTTKPTEVGTYTVLITYDGDANYEAISTTTTLVIEEAKNTTWIWFALAGLIVIAIVGGLIAAKKNMR